jgi:hypothetical protein
MSKILPMTSERAAIVALEAAAFLAARPERMEAFLASSGMDGQTLRSRLEDSGVQQAVLAFILSDDALVLDFCRERDLDPRELHLAHHRLSDPQA